MDEDGLPLIGTGIDYTKVRPLDQKRLLAFVNHFVTHTVRFLNRFACVCEEKMCHMDGQLQRLEITMNILEAKLSSIPGLEAITVSSSATTASANDTPAPAASTPSTAADTTAPPAAAEEQQVPEEAPQPNVPTVTQDPRYAKYFKMLNFGVPLTAVKGKMAAEGFDPNLLDTPDAPAPPGGQPQDSEDDSESDYSDDSSD